jgi:hypothetical protein
MVMTSFPRNCRATITTTATRTRIKALFRKALARLAPAEPQLDELWHRRFPLCVAPPVITGQTAFHRDHPMGHGRYHRHRYLNRAEVPGSNSIVCGRRSDAPVYSPLPAERPRSCSVCRRLEPLGRWAARILVIDADQVSQRTTAHILRNEGYEVLAGATAAAAVKALGAEALDLGGHRRRPVRRGNPCCGGANSQGESPESRSPSLPSGVR